MEIALSTERVNIFYFTGFEQHPAMLMGYSLPSAQVVIPVGGQGTWRTGDQI